MMKITEFIKPSTIWENAKDYEDKGLRQGLVRGYCFETENEKGEVYWTSCTYIHGNVEAHLNESYRYYLEDIGLKFTGRACFRGYGREVYSFEEHDTFIEDVEL